MKDSIRVAPALLLASTLACGDPPAGGPSSASAKSSASARPAPSARPSSPTTATVSTANASAPLASSALPPASSLAAPAEGSLATLFAGPPAPGTKDSKAVASSGGVVLALPEGWNASDDDSNNFTQFRPKELDVEKGVRGASIICGQFDNLDDKNYFKRMVYVDSVEKDTWESAVDGQVGVGPYPAKIAKGTGKQVSQPHERIAYYVHTTPPGAKGVLCVGSYPKSHPELEKEIVTALKGLKSTKAH